MKTARVLSLSPFRFSAIPDGSMADTDKGMEI